MAELQTATIVTAGTNSRASRLTATLIGGFLGVILIFGAGFAGPEILHKAAHDSRHAFSLPCH
jgi:cobalt transporter subunit CbtB